MKLGQKICPNDTSIIDTDDCVVYQENNSEDDCRILQNDLIKLAGWEKQRGMDFHPV
ncbi:hypothetical protein DPMN_009873 [Dreissena polymorpha]|uniref:Uncharacterized protein n=1 Tax=Dreissena polymorpha TaxID=45954 RepID=A0A9D4MYW1_DREPO|nr:hypothetical protein DPMN_009818 [Dreissena polymorpha]KAH3885875.1 hypothetical protein DPMN_009873 [Dreissena polymorpha]